MLVPRVSTADGKRLPGNPVILSADLRQQWQSAADDGMCRSWRQQHPDQIQWLDTNNRHYTIDIDTAEDLQRFEADTGRGLVWPSAILAALKGGLSA